MWKNNLKTAFQKCTLSYESFELLKKIQLKKYLPYVLIATNFSFQLRSVTKNFVYDNSKCQEIKLRK